MLDRVELQLKAGDGGRGAVTFRREKFVPFGGPSGGDGGRGGDVIIKADAGVSTLRAFKHRRSFRAENGQSGMSKNKHGKDGADLVIAVPPGTLVYEKKESGEAELMADLEEDGQKAVVAGGGNGGYGNTHFATAINQAPRVAQPGIPGQNKRTVLELRLIADVGIIGYPNVGKSSLLAALSAANPKIADYPFTTLEPILGVVQADDNSFVLAEIPGLIEGAHAGKGLGHSFLRHAMRTKVLIHLLDGTSASPLDDMIRVNNELALFDATLAKRPQVVAINKLDLPEVQARLEELKSIFNEAGITPVFISAARGDCLKELVAETWQLLKAADVRMRVARQASEKVFRPRPVDRGTRVEKRGNSFILADPAVERLLDKLDLNDPEDVEEFNDRLEKLGINGALKSAGVKSGDTVITGNMEWTWYSDEERHSRRHV
jgi:GTP-binding protein